MKKLLALFAFALVVFTANAQSCPDNNHPHIIDLGLHSGTKWACCNVGTDKPEGYGGYYSWGETEEKNNNDWSTYEHCDGNETSCHNLGSDISGTQYDVAHVKWGGSWVMPSNNQQTELLYYCKRQWTTMNGIAGLTLTGLNGNTIFLPAAGMHWSNDFLQVGEGGNYWSSTMGQYSGISCAWDMNFLDGGQSWAEGIRDIGKSVRPVIVETNYINLPESFSVKSSQAIYNLYGVKVADTMADISTLFPGIYISNGKKFVVK